MTRRDSETGLPLHKLLIKRLDDDTAPPITGVELQRALDMPNSTYYARIKKDDWPTEAEIDLIAAAIDLPGRCGITPASLKFRFGLLTAEQVEERATETEELRQLFGSPIATMRGRRARRRESPRADLDRPSL